MSWPEQPMSAPLDEWQRRVERRGRAIRRRRHVVAAAVTGAALGLGTLVPLAVLSSAESASPDRVQVVTPAESPTPSGARHRPGTPARGGARPDTSAGGGHPSPAGTQPALPAFASRPTVATQADSSTAVAPFAEDRALTCTPSHFGNSTCAGSDVRLDPHTGLLAPTAYVETGNGGTDSDWGASDTAVGIINVPLRLAHERQQVRVAIAYRLASSPTVTTSPGNSGSNSLIVTATPRACRDCAGATTATLVSGTPTGAMGTVTLTLTNPYGAVPAGWIDITVNVESFATIGTCTGPCGQPGAGNARAAVAATIAQVRLQ